MTFGIRPTTQHYGSAADSRPFPSVVGPENSRQKPYRNRLETGIRVDRGVVRLRFSWFWGTGPAVSGGDRRSPVIPDPTTAASRSAVTTFIAACLRARRQGVIVATESSTVDSGEHA